jgi:hypothetical protein
MMSSAQVHSDFRRHEISNIPEQFLASICMGCRFFVATLLNLRRYGMNKRLLGSVASSLCSELNMQTKEVCRGAVNLNLVSAYLSFERALKFRVSLFQGFTFLHR